MIAREVAAENELQGSRDLIFFNYLRQPWLSLRFTSLLLERCVSM